MPHLPYPPPPPPVTLSLGHFVFAGAIATVGHRATERLTNEK